MVEMAMCAKNMMWTQPLFGHLSIYGFPVKPRIDQYTATSYVSFAKIGIGRKNATGHAPHNPTAPVTNHGSHVQFTPPR